jgi:hypothetical protein
MQVTLEFTQKDKDEYKHAKNDVHCEPVSIGDHWQKHFLDGPGAAVFHIPATREGIIDSTKIPVQVGRFHRSAASDDSSK